MRVINLTEYIEIRKQAGDIESNEIQEILEFEERNKMHRRIKRQNDTKRINLFGCAVGFVLFIFFIVILLLSIVHKKKENIITKGKMGKLR
jgi:hypothetical protein